MSDTGQVCLDLERTRELLLDPAAENLALVAEQLRAAMGKMNTLRSGVACHLPLEDRDGWRAGLPKIRLTLDQIGKLLHQAGGLRMQWAQMLLASGGYTPSGEAAALPRGTRLLVEG